VICFSDFEKLLMLSNKVNVVDITISGFIIND